MEVFAAMREIHARQSSIESSCFPANCSRRDQAFSTASWLTSWASAAFAVSLHVRRYSVGMYGETIWANASGFRFRAWASRPGRLCGGASEEKEKGGALMSAVQVAVRAPRPFAQLSI